MREMEFTIEDTEALKPGMEVGVTEGVLKIGRASCRERV